jgi:hypothetical protein
MMHHRALLSDSFKKGIHIHIITPHISFKIMRGWFRGD